MLDEKNADQLVYGARLNIETRDLLPKNVGNALNCASCHLNAGTVADGSPYIGVSAFFPSYAPRAGRVITLEDRINGCFLRSMNGKPLPLDSDEMKAMVAYFDWMRNETKPEDKVEGRAWARSAKIVPNVENGKKIYTQQCALCHGATAKASRTPRASGSIRRCGAMSPSTSAPAWPAPTPQRPSSSATCPSPSTVTSRWARAACRPGRRGRGRVLQPPAAPGLCTQGQGLAQRQETCRCTVLISTSDHPVPPIRMASPHSLRAAALCAAGDASPPCSVVFARGADNASMRGYRRRYIGATSSSTAISGTPGRR
jgi:mono/diheme cytochrome c family protein